MKLDKTHVKLVGHNLVNLGWVGTLPPYEPTILSSISYLCSIQSSLNFLAYEVLEPNLGLAF